MAVHFEMVNNPTANDPVDETEHLGWPDVRVGYGMKVVEHENVCVDEETAGSMCLIQSIACNDFEGIGAKDRQPILGHRCDVQSRSISRNNVHEA